MNKITKLGVSALCGSLAAVSAANAGDLSVSGTVDMSWISMDDTETGNPLDNKEPPELPNTKSVRISKWKLIYNQYDNTKELYDLEKDPNEEQNLIGTGKEIEIKLWHELQKIEKYKAEN